jgi:hypothetical protein
VEIGAAAHAFDVSWGGFGARSAGPGIAPFLRQVTS